MKKIKKNEKEITTSFKKMKIRIERLTELSMPRKNQQKKLKLYDYDKMVTKEFKMYEERVISTFETDV